MANRWGDSGNCQTLFWGAPKSLQMVMAAMKLRHLLLSRKVMTNLDSILKSRDITFPTKVHLVKPIQSSRMDVRVGLWRKLSTKELMVLNCGLKKTLESPLDCKEIQSIHPKGNQYWMFIGRIDAEAETPIVWPPDVKNWLTGKDLEAGKDWRQEEKGMTEDEMVGWYHWLDGHECE